MGRLYLVPDKAEVDRRRGLVRAPRPVEVWPDLYTDHIFWMGDEAMRRVAYGRATERAPAGLCWMGEESKTALDRGDDPLPFLLAIPEAAVSIYYGPRLTDVDSLPSEESLRARVLSAHGIGVIWATYTPSGARNEYRPASPTDATFSLRRPRAATIHLWRLVRTRDEAIAHASQHLPGDSAALLWAEALAARDFEELLGRFGQKGP